MAYPRNTARRVPIMPGYTIYRDILPGQPFDPSVQLMFYPPKDSDELHDALRLAFPHLQTHSERLRDAILKFLVEERRAALVPSPIPASPAVTEASWQSMSSVRSASPASPRLWDQAPSPLMRRSLSDAASSDSYRHSTPPPSQEEMSGVFSLSDSAHPKQHTRRKMTDMEKAEYRKRRIVKACEKCAKRKRKCNHMQGEMAKVNVPERPSASRPDGSRPHAPRLSEYLNVPQAGPQIHPQVQQHTSTVPVVCSATAVVNNPLLSDPYMSTGMSYNHPVPALPDLPMFSITDMSEFPTAPEMQSTSVWSPDGSPAWTDSQDFDWPSGSDPNAMAWEYDMITTILPMSDYTYDSLYFQPESTPNGHSAGEQRLHLDHALEHRPHRNSPQPLILRWLPNFLVQNQNIPKSGGPACFGRKRMKGLSNMRANGRFDTRFLLKPSSKHDDRDVEFDPSTLTDWVSVASRFTMWAVVLLLQMRKTAPPARDYFALNAVDSAPTATSMLPLTGVEMMAHKDQLTTRQHEIFARTAVASLSVAAFLVQFCTAPGFFYMQITMLLVPSLKV